MFAKLILTKAMLEGFIENGCLNHEDAQIVKLRMARWSREKIAEEMHISVSTLDKRINRLKHCPPPAAEHNGAWLPPGPSFAAVPCPSVPRSAAGPSSGGGE